MDKVLILDFGAQYNQLIARRVREAKVYCEIVPYDISIAEIKKIAPEGLILSGGPSSVQWDDPPLPDKKIYNLAIQIHSELVSRIPLDFTIKWFIIYTIK